MGRHTESQDAVSIASSDVAPINGSNVLSRRELRELDTPARGLEMESVQLDSVSVSNLVAEIVAKADAAIAQRIDREIQEMTRAAATPTLTRTPTLAPTLATPPAPLVRDRVRSVAATPSNDDEGTAESTSLPNAAVPGAEIVAPPIPPSFATPLLTQPATSLQGSRQSREPRAGAPRPAPPRTAPPRGIAASVTRPHSRRRNTARFLSVTAMVFVAAMAVATSVPANALLTPQDVEALNGAASKDVVATLQDGQSVEASGQSVVAGRDGVSVTGAEPVKAYVDVSSNRISPVVPNSSSPMVWPFPSPVPLTDGFGPRANMWTWGGWTGNFHSGQDFDPGYGTPIRSIADGIVVEVSSSLCGQAVVVSHNLNGEKFDSEYCHMIYGSPNVTVGQSITAGTIVGNVGQTGMATGPHLHLEIHIGGNSIDPIPFLRAHSKEW